MSGGSQTVRMVRVFVSSPGDVAAERDVMKEVVDGINRSDGQAGGFRLELFRWEDDVIPQIGPKPQQVVDNQTPVYDIYVGILKHRFGTPTGRHGSGTEKEFRDALKRWGETGWPWILFYFCQDAVNPGDLDLKQYGKVDTFRKQLQNKGGGIYGTYKGVRGSPESFYEKVSEHLRKIVQRLIASAADESARHASPSAPDKIKILFLAALPDDQSRLRLDREYREIEARIRASDGRDRLELVSGWAVRVGDLQRLLLQEKPQIVHFSGHGSAAEQLIFEDDAGRSHPVTKKALTGLFGILKDRIQAVVLNACFSQPQAEAIANVVGCAVGMKQAIGDRAAIEFASAFYQAIAYGKPPQAAFDLGCNALELLNIPEENTPQLLLRGVIREIPPAYIDWLLARCCEVELTGLELKHGSGVRLNHVYTPLATSARLEDAAGKPGRQEEMLPDQDHDRVQLLLDLLDKQSLYVSGDAGSGKSTFCRWVTWLACNGEMPEVDDPAGEQYLETFPATLRGRLPLFIQLRDFWRHLPPGGISSIGPGGIESALEKWLADQKYPGLDWACLKGHLKGGSALLMLDGVDEVPPVWEKNGDEWFPRQMLLTGLAEAAARWTKGGNRVLVTSRSYGLNSEQQRKLGLVHAPILSLDPPLQALLVRRWFVHLKEDRDLGLETANAMIDHIHVERGLDELAANPLLLTAMCIIYDDGKRLPHDKYTLYDRIVDTVLHKRHAEKERIDPIRGRLAALAFGMHTGEGLRRQRETPEASATKDEIEQLLATYRGLDGSTDKGLSDIVRVREALLSQSGLLVSRGDDGASFFHLSIQEFLAAKRLFVLHRGKSDDVVVKLFLDRGRIAGWRNTLSFYFGCLVAAYDAHAGVDYLRGVVKGIELPPADAAERSRQDPAWNQAIVLADGLQILAGREAAIPQNLTSFCRRCVFQAIEQEIAVHERHTLALALGRLGDPRIEVDLRVPSRPDGHPGYVNIPAGNYVIGEEKKAISINEPFWLSKYPVTNSQYARFIEAGGYTRREFWSDEGWKWRNAEGITLPGAWRMSAFNSPNQPVVGVSWWEADAFCRWAGGFLPTEQQWESAARGPEGFEYPWGDRWEVGLCNSREIGLGGTSAVGLFPRDKSPFGLQDMAGNVWEWCADLWEEGATNRVIRGGSWILDARNCRAANRRRNGPRHRGGILSFRVAAVPLSKSSQEPTGQAAEQRASRNSAR